VTAAEPPEPSSRTEVEHLGAKRRGFGVFVLLGANAVIVRSSIASNAGLPLEFGDADRHAYRFQVPATHGVSAMTVKRGS